MDDEKIPIYGHCKTCGRKFWMASMTAFERAEQEAFYDPLPDYRKVKVLCMDCYKDWCLELQGTWGHVDHDWDRRS